VLIGIVSRDLLAYILQSDREISVVLSVGCANEIKMLQKTKTGDCYGKENS